MIIKASLKNAPVLQPEKRERTLFFLSVVTSWTHRCSLFCTPGAKYNTHTYTLNRGEIRPQLQRIMMFTLFPPRPPGYFILCRYLTLSASLSLPPSSCPQMFLTVYLSNNDQHFTEVPVTPETLCRDVVELCKEPGETDCHLSEMWRGSGEWRCQFNPVLSLSIYTQWTMFFSHMLFCLWSMAVCQGTGDTVQFCLPFN